MKPTDAIIEKIRKCLSLANGLNATQGEMENAMAKAKEIAMRHSIDIASISMEQPESNLGIEIEKDEMLKIRSQYSQPYHRWIFIVLQKCFDVRVIYNRFSDYGGTRIVKITLIGEATDVLIAREIFPWLEKTFPKILSTAVREGRLTYCAAHTNGCYMGIANGLIAANKREKEKLVKEDANAYAMVLVKKDDLIKAAVEEAFPKLKTQKSRQREVSDRAYGHGYSAGSCINLNQMGGPSKQSALK
jgi:hypothetical protein